MKEKKTYSVIAFDLDGTLTNPEHGLIGTFEYALGKMGLDYGTRESLKRFIGPPLFDEWQKEFGISPEESTRALGYFKEYYEVDGWWDNEVYPGVPEMLEALFAAGKRIILASSKPERFARKILEKFGLAKYFKFIGGAVDDKIRDKKHEVLSYSLESIGSPPLSEVILIGDRRFDAEGAKICGVDSAAVLYGHGSEQELRSSGFNYILRDTREVLELLL